MLAFLAFLCVLWVGYWLLAFIRDLDRPSPIYLSKDRCADCVEGNFHYHPVKHPHARLSSEGAVAGNVSDVANNSPQSDISSSGNNAHARTGADSKGSVGVPSSSNASPNTSNTSSTSSASSALDSSSDANVGRNFESSGSGRGLSDLSDSSDSNQSSSTYSSGASSSSNADSQSSAGDRSGSAGSAGFSSSGTNSVVTPLYTRPVGAADDLKAISGVGDVLEGTLNELGITTYKQLAEFEDSDVQRVSDALSEQNSGFGDRIVRDDWVGQAKLLAGGGSLPSNASGSSNISSVGQGSSGDGASAGQGGGNSSSRVTPLYTRPSGKADDLKVISGVGDVMEGTLNDLGITTYQQLADFQNADVQKVSEALSDQNAGFGDRIVRDDWVGQAKILAAGGTLRSSSSQSGRDGQSSVSGVGSQTGGSTKSGLTAQFERPSDAADDLTKIRGIGDVMQDTLNDLGITTYRQLSMFQDADVETIKNELSKLHAGFGDRIKRDKWITQAKLLADKKG